MVTTIDIEPDLSWENDRAESLCGRLRDQLLDRETFHTLQEAQVLTAHFRQTDNPRLRPHGPLA